MSRPEPLQPGEYYHIYNRGINGEPIFRQERNYRHFLMLYGKYVAPIAETYAYCLLSNHFHFLVRIKEAGPATETGTVKPPSRHFNNLFIAYAKAFNKAFERTGSLFESPFKRRLVDNERYFACLVTYIHRNPERHGFVEGFRQWPYSSYHAVLSPKPSRIERAAVFGWFDGREGFDLAHTLQVDEAAIEPLIADDWV